MWDLSAAVIYTIRFPIEFGIWKGRNELWIIKKYRRIG